MLQRFGMQDCKPAATPLPNKAVLGPRGPDEQPLPPQAPYGSLVHTVMLASYYVDASWGEDPSTRKSQSGYVFTLGNAAISWKSKLQTTVALSSTEAEYLALSAAVKEALFLRNLVGDVLPSAAKTIVLHEDNQSTIKQALNLTGSERTKHVDIRHHFLKAHVANGDVRLEYLPTAQQPADALTKPVDRVKVSLFSQIMLGTTA